jgi:NitT/TauT family transport system ATP-binding protein
MDLHLRGVSHRYGAVDVLADINLDIKHGEIVCIVGPSGCGKSTLLRCLGGLEKPTSGSLALPRQLHLIP